MKDGHGLKQLIGKKMFGVKKSKKLVNKKKPANDGDKDD